MTDYDDHEWTEYEKKEPCRGECCEDFCTLCEECPHDCECTSFEKNVYDELFRNRQTIKELMRRIEKLEQRSAWDNKTIMRYKVIIDKLNEDVDLR